MVKFRRRQSEVIAIAIVKLPQFAAVKFATQVKFVFAE